VSWISHTDFGTISTLFLFLVSYLCAIYVPDYEKVLFLSAFLGVQSMNTPLTHDKATTSSFGFINYYKYLVTSYTG
jgi:hypothetical protein